MPICKLILKAQKTTNIPQNPKTLGDHLKKRRLEQKLFQSDVARILGVEETSVNNWENNRSNPTIKIIPKIFEFLRYIPDIFPQKTIGEKLIYYRKVHGLSQKELARKLGIDPTTLRRWERSRSRPTKKDLNNTLNLYLPII